MDASYATDTSYLAGVVLQVAALSCPGANSCLEIVAMGALDEHFDDGGYRRSNILFARVRPPRLAHVRPCNAADVIRSSFCRALYGPRHPGTSPKARRPTAWGSGVGKLDKS